MASEVQELGRTYTVKATRSDLVDWLEDPTTAGLTRKLRQAAEAAVKGAGVGGLSIKVVIDVESQRSDN